jgi:hypothetical protein
MARWTVYLRHSERGWEWTPAAGNQGWWGFYKTEGHAKSAAKRSLPRVSGAKTNPADFEFIKRSRT